MCDCWILLSFWPLHSQAADCQDGWQCPGVIPGSCFSSLCAVLALSKCSLHPSAPLTLLCCRFGCCFAPWRKPILFYSYHRKNKSGVTRKNMECKHVFPGHQHASKRAWKWVLIYCMIQCLQDYQVISHRQPNSHHKVMNFYYNHVWWLNQQTNDQRKEQNNNNGDNNNDTVIINWQSICNRGQLANIVVWGSYKQIWHSHFNIFGFCLHLETFLRWK